MSEIREFFENYGSYGLLFFILMAYLLLKRFLTKKRFENTQFYFDEPEEVARLMVKEYKVKNPDMIIGLSNLEKMKDMISFITAKLLSV